MKCKHRKIWRIEAWTTKHLQGTACVSVTILDDKYPCKSSCEGVECAVNAELFDT